MPTRLAFLFALALVPCASSRAEVTLPRLFTDRMILQRDLPIHVWGWADPRESVSATFQNETANAQADDLGRWSLYLKPRPAGGPYTLSVKGSNTVKVEDILLGDVWVASGQSNMEWTLKKADDAQAAIAAATHPRIRFFRVDRKASNYPVDDVPETSKGWLPSTPENAPDFTAIGYFFAVDLEKTLDVPIGIIDTSWGGTPVASFTSLPALSQDAGLMPVFAQWSKMAGRQSGIVRTNEKEDRAYERAVEEAAAKGRTKPEKKWRPNFESWSPAGIYNGMIAPVTPYAIRGAIWYQGESDANFERAPIYSKAFQTMISGWRNDWGVGDFPFLFVQLTSYIAGPKNAWPELREAQLETLQLTNTGMAVTLDVGTPKDIHPPYKHKVADRLALAARAIAYGEKTEFSGPIFRQAIPEENGLRLFFDHTAGGLKAEGGRLASFEVAGEDGKFSPAEARIERDTILVTSSNVPRPLTVRYAWADNPVGANLYNGAGLPASPFRSSK